MDTLINSFEWVNLTSKMSNPLGSELIHYIYNFRL